MEKDSWSVGDARRLRWVQKALWAGVGENAREEMRRDGGLLKKEEEERLRL
jgi:hypothetical protein